MSSQLSITSAIFHITYVCSHQCPMCYANAGEALSHPKINQLCDIVDRLADLGIKDITLVGGDPAPYPDIVTLAKYIKSKSIQLSILSNTLDFPSGPEAITDYIDIYEGTIHHSLKERHDSFCGYKGAYEKLLRNLLYFSNQKKQVGLAVNLIPYNYEVIYDLIESVVSNGINLDHVVFQRIIQFGRASGSYNYELTNEMLERIMHQVEKAEDSFGIKVIFEDPFPMCSVKDRYRKYMHPCEWGRTKVSVDYSGNLSRCGADVFHSFGSIFDEQIDEKWNNDPTLMKFRNMEYLPQKCTKCKYIDVCRGGCPISREPTNGFSLDYLAN